MHPSHKTRLSDSSLYDEVCVKCGVTDTQRASASPCPKAPEKPSEALSAVEKALSLAVNMLAQHEPGDSRAVSDEFVAIAAVHTGDTSEPVMRVIDTALEEAMTEPTKPYLRRAMQEPPQ